MKTDRSRTTFLALAAIFAAVSIAACSDPVPDSAREGQGRAGAAQADPQAVGLRDGTEGTIADYLQAEEEYRTYFTLLQLADLAGTTAIGDGVTVFAPTNAAVAADAARVDPLLAPASIASIERAAKTGSTVEVDDPKALSGFLSGTLSRDELLPTDLRTRRAVYPIEGKPLPLKRTAPGRFTLAGTRIGLDGIALSNGVVYPAAGLISP